MSLFEDPTGSGLFIPHSECAKEAVQAVFAAVNGAEPTCYAGLRTESPGQGVVGIIAIVGDVTWSMMLGFPRDSAAAFAQKFAGFEIPFESPDMGDVVGEMANVIAGDVVARLDAKGIRAEMSLPTVTRGNDVDLLVPEGVVSAHMRFACPDGGFWLKLAAANAKRRIT
jgi:chemotaxis protein CheX